MTEHELIHKAIAGSMPDIEAVRNRCISKNECTSADEIKKSYPIKRFVSVAACVVVVLAVACAIIPYMNSFFRMGSISEGKARVSAAKPADSTLQQSKSAVASFITVNELTKLPSAGKMNIALKTNDFVKMSRKELCDFYGVNVFPSIIPKDLSEAQNPTYGIYRRNNGTGDVYFSQNGLSYANSSVTKTLNIDVSKGQLPHTDIATFENGKNIKSTINGNELSIGHYSADKDDYYYAEFSYHDVGFRIFSDNLTKAEFVDMLSSILK